jgi:hypothetical protein
MRLVLIMISALTLVASAAMAEAPASKPAKIIDKAQVTVKILAPPPATRPVKL